MGQLFRTPKAKKKLWAEKIRMTQKSYDSLSAELAHRLTTLRPQISKKVGLAVEFGDLPENAAWDATTKEERQNELRIIELRDRLDRAEIVPDNISDAVADINDRIILDIDGKEENVQLLPVSPEPNHLIHDLSNKAHSQKNQSKITSDYRFLSVDSPIGLAVFGKKENFQAKIDTPDGSKTVRLVQIIKG